MGTIYILARANNTNNNYQISISKSNEEQCDNDCSKNGICEVEKVVILRFMDVVVTNLLLGMIVIKLLKNYLQDL